MSTGYKIEKQDALHFLTFQIVGWLDLFTRKVYRDIVIDCFRHCQQQKGLELYGYVIMSNHIHLLARSSRGDLSGLIRDFKSFTSKQFEAAMMDSGESRREWMTMVFEYHARFKPKQDRQFWTHENHAEELFSQSFIEQKLQYIHQNPVRAAWVINPEDYLYSSARNYAGMEALLDIVFLDLRWKTV